VPLPAKHFFDLIRKGGSVMIKKIVILSLLFLCLIPSLASATFYLPDTGQTLCYDASGNVIDCPGTGQDGAYSINPMSYTDNNDGTVTDRITGLMWQKCSVGQDDQTCIGAATPSTWDQAQTACGDLNQTVFAGHSDWRLPSKKELITIVDYGVSYPGPTIDQTFPYTVSGSTSYYWTSTPNAGNTTDAWYVTFDYGSVYHANKDPNIPNPTKYYVRCVRGEPTAQSFKDNGNNTVTDNRTGLTWQKKPEKVSSYRITWADALSYCEGLSLGGHTDWRLPDAKEFESLADDTRFNPSINTKYFPDTDYIYTWWSSTTRADSPTYGWYVAFGGGTVANIDTKDFYLNVRCVRGKNSWDITPPVNGTLSITPALNEVLNLSWSGFTDTQSGVASYILVAGTTSTPTCSSTPIYTGPDTSFSHTNLTLGKTYYYRVCALDKAGNISTGATASQKVLSEYTPPTGSVVINSGDLYTKTAKVTLTINADDNGGSGLYQMCVSNTATCTAWIPYATSKAWTLTTGDGPKTVNILFKDKNGNATAPADAYHSNSIILDTKPPLGTITINGGAYSTNDPNVTLSLSVADVNGVTDMQFSTNNNWTGVPWETFAPTKAYTVPATTGVRTVYARFRDVAGNVSAVCSDTIIYSATPPPTGTPGAVTINGGAQFTTTTAAQLTITSPDSTFTQMRFSTDGITKTAWETLKPTKSLALPGGDGVKTVYAQFSDAGGTKSGIYMDTIILDTKPPVGTISINGGAATTTNQLVTLSLSAADANGVTYMQFSTNNKWTGLSWETFSPTKSFDLGTAIPGNKSVYVRFMDAAGKISPAYSAIIKLVAP
jgi:Protein of unknown function (DUF1566)